MLYRHGVVTLVVGLVGRRGDAGIIAWRQVSLRSHVSRGKVELGRPLCARDSGLLRERPPSLTGRRRLQVCLMFTPLSVYHHARNGVHPLVQMKQLY